MSKHTANPIALITGITGQDGAYLADFLLKKQYKVYGLYRRVSTPNFWRLLSRGIYDKVHLISGDVTDMSSLLEALVLSQPTEVYNLAAQSFVGASFEKPLCTTDVDGLGTARLLEAIRILNPKIKLYQASSSEIYGNLNADELPIKEESRKIPVSPYAAAKLYSYNMVRIYRESYGLFATNGILFNHESPLRGLEFVTRKISNAVAKIALGLEKELVMGNLEGRRDWGYAPEYVEGMWQIMQHSEPDDFVLATGRSHSVQELIEVAFGNFKLDWKKYVKSERRFFRPTDVNHLLGDSSKAARILGWKTTTDALQLIRSMADADYQCWQRHLKGEIFPWDAPNYPSEVPLTSQRLNGRDVGLVSSAKEIAPSV
jgi:GDPmannose 4,6-dehydratase